MLLRLLPSFHRFPTISTIRSSQPITYASLHFLPFLVSTPNTSNLTSNPNSPTSISKPHHLNPCFDSSSSYCSSSLDEDEDSEIELGRLLVLLPEEMRRKVSEHPELHHLIEIVMDLGRKPLARFPTGDFVLSDLPITFQDLEHATAQVGDFATDNRAGISRTLHRISAIRNRKGVIIGLTCRVGRAMSGSANLLRDLVYDGGSLLLIGPPGVGKTTIIREIARMLADDYGKRVMIVDTSNEIGGDGDIPHPGIGGARRLQVPNADLQHKVLIEAVENHMPQVIVIDEISTKLEAMAASTIAQRGIQLVATAHGVTIENLIMNPSLEMLVGGIQSVTLGDEEASRRGVQKTVLERRGPSTFTCGVEIISKTELRVHCNLEATVDALLSGRSPNFEVRKLNAQGFANEIFMVEGDPSSDENSSKQHEIIPRDALDINGERFVHDEYTNAAEMLESTLEDALPIHLYVYGILETSVVQAIRELKKNDTIGLTDNISKADGLLALHSKLKKNSRIQVVAKSRDIPIYVTKTSSLLQITKAIHAFMREHADGVRDSVTEDKETTRSSEKLDALEEARLAIEQIVIPRGKPVELLPRSSSIISLQMSFIKKYQLQSEKIGKEPNVRLRILPLHASETEAIAHEEMIDDLCNMDDLNGSHSSATKLPLLSDW
eukprot:TRINITY_DN33604_c1_g1_i6.p1 TRINITY_DN33604_c1_g1~~TRINITY_DN33604_c1_g1_i6.p1  ORF type:complete len:666 (-),score=139.09 TRINITY_DN33604_c1_g1_i6:391-2388(-)